VPTEVAVIFEFERTIWPDLSDGFHVVMVPDAGVNALVQVSGFLVKAVTLLVKVSELLSEEQPDAEAVPDEHVSS
jgi:hypothetical protein